MLKIATVVLLVAVSFLFVTPVLAHKVNIFAFIEDGVVYSESYFADGKPVVDGKVLVFSGEQQLLLEGRTDKQGNWQFPLPGKGALTLVIEAGLGHRGQFHLQPGGDK